MHFTTAECVVEVEVVEDKVIEVPDNSTTSMNSTEAEKDSNSKDEAADAKSDKDQSADETKSEKDQSADEEKSEEKAEGDKQGANKDGEKAEKGEQLAGATAHMVFYSAILCVLWAARAMAA
jgi:hypoxia up-regulated 1